MKHSTFWSNLKRLGLALSPAMLLAPTLVMPTPAGGVEFPPTSGRGAPSRTAGGGMRGDSCQAAEQAQLTVLAPTDNTSTFVGDEVTLLFYVPEVTDKMAEIYVEDPETFDVVYEATFPLGSTPGLVEVSFPVINQATGTPLEVGKNYFWEFAVVCNPDDRAIDLAVSGRIQPVAVTADLTQQLEQADRQDLSVAAVYAAAGIWQETVTHMASERCEDPSAWTELLTSVGLDTVIEQSLAACEVQP